MKIIDRFRSLGSEVADDIVEAETAAARSLWASRAVVWPAILLLVVFAGIGGYVAGHGVASHGVARLRAEQSTLASELKAALTDNAQSALALKAAKERIAELTQKPLGLVSAVPPALVSAVPATKPKVKVRKARAPAAPAADGGWMGALVKTLGTAP